MQVELCGEAAYGSTDLRSVVDVASNATGIANIGTAKRSAITVLAKEAPNQRPLVPTK